VIVLKSRLAAVVEVAIGFDHEPPLFPKEVDEIWADPNIDLGQRQPMASAQAQEVSLQVTAGAIAALLANRQADHVGLADGLAQLAGGHGAGPSRRESTAQIRNRPRRSRDWNTATKGHVGR
jgi:hypothetical protein